MPEGETTKKPPSEDSDDEEDEEEEEDKHMALYKKIKQDFPYDITKEKWMNKIVTMNSYFKVRVYLLACQNLTASDSSVELKSKLAGMQALCSADPYPIIIIGEGDKGATDGKVKSTNDRETALD